MSGRPPARDTDLIPLYRATIRPLYGYVSRRVGGDRTLAEDVVQEAWLRAVTTWRTRGLPDEPLAWLTLVARNLIVDHFRRQRPEPIDPARLELEAPSWTPDSPDEAALIAAGLARLARRHADLLEAFYFDGKSVRELAAERASSERAIEGRLRRARGRLKAQLDKLAAGARPAPIG